MTLGADPIGPNVMHQLSSPILHAHAPTRNSMNNTCGIGRADLPPIRRNSTTSRRNVELVRHLVGSLAGLVTTDQNNT